MKSSPTPFHLRSGFLYYIVTTSPSTGRCLSDTIIYILMIWFSFYWVHDLVYICYRPYEYLDHTRTVRPYEYGPTVHVRSYRMSILIRSSTSWTIRVFRPYGFFSIETYHKLLLSFTNYIYHNYYYFKQNTTTSWKVNSFWTIMQLCGCDMVESF